MSDRWAEFGQMDKSPACGREEHSGCAHVAALGGGFNPRRVRLEVGAGLCPCSCHSSCPVALSDKRITVPFKTWRESCTCPGAEQERRRLDDDDVDLRDLDERWEDRRHRSRAYREAFQPARASAGRQGPRRHPQDLHRRTERTRLAEAERHRPGRDRRSHQRQSAPGGPGRSRKPGPGRQRDTCAFPDHPLRRLMRSQRADKFPKLQNDSTGRDAPGEGELHERSAAGDEVLIICSGLCNSSWDELYLTAVRLLGRVPNATKMIEGLTGMGQYPDAAARAFQETDTPSRSGTEDARRCSTPSGRCCTSRRALAPRSPNWPTP